jgi:hypothetical protein
MECYFLLKFLDYLTMDASICISHSCRDGEELRRFNDPLKLGIHSLA